MKKSDLIVAGANGAKSILRILANLSLADRITRGKYDNVDLDITEEHFPTNVPADYDTEHKLFHFGPSISSEAAIAEMEKEGFRPGTLAELLVLGETQPELQKQFPIIALGSLWLRSDGSRLVPELVCSGRSDGIVPELVCNFRARKLSLTWFGNVWVGIDSFLGVRK